jgi:hypothetical protein
MSLNLSGWGLWKQDGACEKIISRETHLLSPCPLYTSAERPSADTDAFQKSFLFQKLKNMDSVSSQFRVLAIWKNVAQRREAWSRTLQYLQNKTLPLKMSRSSYGETTCFDLFFRAHRMLWNFKDISKAKTSLRRSLPCFIRGCRRAPRKRSGSCAHASRRSAWNVTNETAMKKNASPEPGPFFTIPENCANRR